MIELCRTPISAKVTIMKRVNDDPYYPDLSDLNEISSVLPRASRRGLRMAQEAIRQLPKQPPCLVERTQVLRAAFRMDALYLMFKGGGRFVGHPTTISDWLGQRQSTAHLTP